MWCCGAVVGYLCCEGIACYDSVDEMCCGNGDGTVCDKVGECCDESGCVTTCPGSKCCDRGTCVSSCPTGKCCDDGVCVGIAECSGNTCCDEGVCVALEGCESCIDDEVEDDKSKCTGECNNCIDAECDDDSGLCDPGDVCVDGTCCDTASAGSCTVTDDDVGYDPDDCVENVAGAGQCTGGLGYHIASYSQCSTEENAAGPGTVDVDGCSVVTYSQCHTVLISIDPRGHVFACFPHDEMTTVNMGTHDECPSE